MMAAGRMLALKLRIETRIARMADPPPFTQTGKRLEIHTVLNDGTPLINALLLIWVKGSEEVSQPYTYHVKMWRLVNNTRPPIPPADMINTQASIHTNFKQTLKDNPNRDNAEPEIRTHVRRCGVFETFNDEGLVLGTTAEVEGEKFQIRQYSGTIVPAFKMMSYETAYRVFENKTVIEIIDEVTDGFPNFKLDKSRLGSASFPKMAYCVQYNESTFNFLSRLMAQFGIWYFFDHNQNQNEDLSKMMLGTGQSNFDPCQTHGGARLRDGHPVHQLTEINNKNLQASALIIKDFQRVYAPMTRRGRFGNFNLLEPTKPITNFSNIQVGRDLIRPERSVLQTKSTSNREPDDDDRFRTEHFAAPVDINSAPAPGQSGEAPDAKTHASQWMLNREAMVARVSGSTRNAALMPGFTFDRMSPAFKAHGGSGEDVIGDEEKQVAEAGTDILVFTNPNLPKPNVVKLGTYVVLRIEFEGLETAYSHQKEDLPTILKDLLFPKNLTTDDVLANSTVQALNNYLQKAVPQNIKDGTMPDLDLEPLLPGGSALGMLGSAIPLIIKVIERLKGIGASNDFHSSFAAIPLNRIDYQADGRPTTDAPLLSLPLPGGWGAPAPPPAAGRLPQAGRQRAAPCRRHRRGRDQDRSERCLCRCPRPGARAVPLGPQERRRAGQVVQTRRPRLLGAGRRRMGRPALRHAVSAAHRTGSHRRFSRRRPGPPDHYRTRLQRRPRHHQPAVSRSRPEGYATRQAEQAAFDRQPRSAAQRHQDLERSDQ